jgi:hypothetical protein
MRERNTVAPIRRRPTYAERLSAKARGSADLRRSADPTAGRTHDPRDMARTWSKTTWLPYFAAGWAAVYGVVRTWWALGHAPQFRDYPAESFVPGAWTPVALALAAVVAGVLIGVGKGRRWRSGIRWALAGLGWLAGGGLVLYSFMFALNIAGLLFGEGFDGAGLAARGSGVVGGVLVAVVAAAELRRARRCCARCGRVHGRTPEGRTDSSPWWAYAAAYLTVAGCLVRIGAQVLVGFDDPDADDPDATFAVFLGLMVLAGTLLPLALVHRWGRIWPRWVVPFAGRAVPRWVVLVPAWFMGAGLTGYFGIAGVGSMVREGLGGGYPVWFGFAAIGGYVAWGVGLLVASVSYFVLTKPACPVGRGSRVYVPPSPVGG